MAKKRKFPKKPKAKASVAVLENYLKRVADVKKHNAGLITEKKKKETLRKRIVAITK